MPRLLTALGVVPLLFAAPAYAQVSVSQATPIAAPAEPQAIPLYGDRTPGRPDGENWARQDRIGTVVRNVTYPTLTPVFPTGRANGAAVIVAPGGAYMMLAMAQEGWKIADALAARGITAFVLKYRVLPTPAGEKEAADYMARRMEESMGEPGEIPDIGSPGSTEDALAALAMVRGRAAEWHVDPERVGMIGFSAGAMTTLNAILHATGDQGPAFAGYIYGPQATVEVPASAPPLFAGIAMDDQFFPPAGFPLVSSWLNAGRKVEVHAYQQARHGFGPGVPGTTTAGVLDQFVAWLAMQGFLGTDNPAE